MKMHGPKVLVVEDEEDARSLIVYHLKREGFNVFETDDGYDCVRLLNSIKPDVVLLDLMINGLDGVQVCRLLRADHSIAKTPVIVVSARSQEEQVLQTFDLGIEDYVRKPFRIKEVVARVRAVLRRTFSTPSDEGEESVLSFPPLELNTGCYLVTLEGNTLNLTATEFRLLRYLMQNAGRVYSRQQLTAQVSDHPEAQASRAIDVHIRSLRVKLGAHARLIDTTRGVGYCFRPYTGVTKV